MYAEVGPAAAARQHVLLPQIPSLCPDYTITPLRPPTSRPLTASNFYGCRHYAIFACVAITMQAYVYSALYVCMYLNIYTVNICTLDNPLYV